MMALTRSDLWSLEQYSEKRSEFRKEVIAHKKIRRVDLSPNARLLFEDQMTVRYQIQEMLRIEKIFEAAGIQDELDAYNPLIPDGSNWKATFMLEFEDPDDRKRALAGLIGVEDQVWVQVGESEKVFAIADEDLDRENDVKTSSVHFLRFEFDDRAVNQAKAGLPIRIGCDHPALKIAGIELDADTAASLVSDLKG